MLIYSGIPEQCICTRRHPLSYIKDFLGHVSVNTTIYMHPQIRHDETALEKINKGDGQQTSKQYPCGKVMKK